jgi:hypothetical protein
MGFTGDSSLYIQMDGARRFSFSGTPKRASRTIDVGSQVPSAMQSKSLAAKYENDLQIV